MDTSVRKNNLKFGIIAVLINIFGIIFSGLVFPVISLIFCPQPPWKDAALFIQSFNPLQTATFFCGFFLVIGSLLTFVVLTQLCKAERKIWAISALSINIFFTAVVFINYVIQTTYIPYLANNNPPEASMMIPAFSMANPGSFAWALEMYGWGGIGLSFIFMAFIFGKEKYETTLKILFIINGICSFVSALMTSVDMNWLFSSAGLLSLIIWNLLVLFIDIFLLMYFKNNYKENLNIQ